MQTWQRQVTGLFAVALSISGAACVPSTNVCDPDAPPSERKTVTIRGRVVDQDGLGREGVPVFVSGGPSTTSGSEGRFELSALLPNDDGRGYDLLALPPEPVVGGRTTVDPLGCNETAENVEVPVIVPPPSPEVEIAEATSPDRLFVAFSAASEREVTMTADDVEAALASCDDGAGLRYTVEVRAPFGAWQRAVLAPAPLPGAELGQPVVEESVKDAVDDVCARATCASFTYAHPAVGSAPNARCVEVAGVRLDDGTLANLNCYERYEVRVRAEIAVDDVGQADHALPARVPSAASANPGELSLTPTTTLPVPMAADATTNTEMHAALDVKTVVPIGPGRFALIDGTTVAVVGGGDMSEEARTEALGIPPATDDGMCFDGSTTDAAAAEVEDNAGEAVAMLPAGKWVRVWKRIGGASMIDKVFIGAKTGDVPQTDEGQQPMFNIDMAVAAANEELRGFRWLTAPSEDPLNGPYNPPDAYVLLFQSGLVMLEQADANAAMMGDDGLVDDFYPASSVGLCTGINALGTIEIGGNRKSGACWDLRGSRPDVDLADLQILRTTASDASPSSTFHVLADRASDEVIVVRSDHLLGDALPGGATSIEHVATTVKVGLEPMALLPTRILDCASGSVDPVLLVANRGSQDLSVLEVEDGAVQETAVISMPAVPVRFFPDLAAPTCDDPYAWVVGDDGRTFPVDMRADRLGIPMCGEVSCAVETRSRARAGAVGRKATGRGRVLLGGEGVLAEVGYLRPALTPCFEDCGR